MLAISVDVETFFLAALSPIFLFIPSPKRTDLGGEKGKSKSMAADIREGAMYIWRRRSFLWLLGTFTVANFVGGTMILLPLVLKFQLAPDWTSRRMTFEAALAVLTTTMSVGGVIG